MAQAGYTDAGSILLGQDPEGRPVRARATASGSVIQCVEEPEVPPNTFTLTVDGVGGNPSTAAKSVAASRAEDERKAEIGMNAAYHAYDADPSSWSVATAAPDYGDALQCTVRNDISGIHWISRRQPGTGIKLTLETPAEAQTTIYWYERAPNGQITGPDTGPIVPDVVANSTHTIVLDNSLALTPKTSEIQLFNSRSGNESPQHYRTAVVFLSGPTAPGGGPKTWRVRNLRTTAETPTV